MRTIKSNPGARASFTNRMTAHVVDLALAGLAGMCLPGHGATRFLAAIVWVYFLLWDLFAGRTPGKMLFGLHYVTRAGQPVNKVALILRSFYRLLGPLLVLSWKRCSVLDGFSGIRVAQGQGELHAAPSRRARPPVR